MADVKQQAGCGSILLVALCFVAVSKMCSGSSDSSATTPAAIVATAPLPRKVESPPVPSPSPEPKEPRPALKGSKAAFQAWFTRLGFTFKESPLADGTPREMAHEGTVIIETIGYRDTLERASLTIGIDPKDIAGLASVTGAMMVFMRETGWEAGRSWVTTTMKKPNGGTITKNGVTYKLVTIIPGMYNLAAGPAGVKEPD